MEQNAKGDFDLLLDELRALDRSRDARDEAAALVDRIQTGGARMAKSRSAMHDELVTMAKSAAAMRDGMLLADRQQRVDDTRAKFNEIVAKADAAAARGDLTGAQASYLDAILPRIAARVGAIQ
jgi:hypothetical protein